MGQLDDKGKRIVENIFDIIMKNDENGSARFNLDLDLADLNVFVDKHAGLMVFEDNDMKEVYTLTIKKIRT